MRQPKVREAHLACDVCNGFGFVVRMPNIDMATLEASINAGLGDKPIETAEVNCIGCAGTGRLTPRGNLREATVQ
jgi:hypothetical protein